MNPTPEMIEAAKSAYRNTATYSIVPAGHEDGLLAALTAALALLPGEPVAWLWFNDGVEQFTYGKRQPIEGATPLYASPAPLPVAVQIKPLEWEKGKQSNWTVWRAKGFGVTYECAAKVYNEGWMWGTREGDTNFDAADEDDAKAAAQADHESRIRSALSSPVGGTAQCCMCGKKGLSTVEGDGGPECELSDGRWVCSIDCWDKAVEATPASDIAALREENGILSEALKRMENCYEQLAATRTHEIYTAMINGGQTEALLDLDNARRNARSALQHVAKGGRRHERGHR